jgi:membrane protease subunit HflC
VNKLAALLAILGAGAFVLISSIYTVSEVEQMIITQFGKPVGEPVTTAGLKVKIPFIQQVNPIDKRVLEWDGSPSDMPTKDKLSRTSSTYPSICSPAGGLPIRCSTF